MPPPPPHRRRQRFAAAAWSGSSSAQIEEQAPCFARILRDGELWKGYRVKSRQVAGLVGGIIGMGMLIPVFTIQIALGSGLGAALAGLTTLGLLATTIYNATRITMSHMKHQAEEDPRSAAARRARGRMMQNYMTGRLHGEIHPLLLETMEMACRNFYRIVPADGVLPPRLHSGVIITDSDGSAARQKASIAAQVALEEAILEVSALVPPVGYQKPIGNKIAGFVNAMMGRQEERPLTAAEQNAIFEVARLAESLGQVGDELDRLSPQEGTVSVVDGKSALREALGALKVERQAREELEQELRIS